MVGVSGTTIGLLEIKKKDARNVKSTKNKGEKTTERYKKGNINRYELLKRLCSDCEGGD